MFLFMNQITQILLFLGIPVLQRSKITVWERHLFKKNFCNGTFGFVSALSKNIFSGAQVKYFCLSGPNNPDFTMKKKKREREFCFFRECRFWRDQRLQFENNTFSKKICATEVLGLCLPYVKRHFKDHQLSVFFFMAQITQIHLLPVMPISQRSKITLWAQ